MSKWWDETPVSARDETTKKIAALFDKVADAPIGRDHFTSAIVTSPLSPSIWEPCHQPAAEAMFDAIDTEGAGLITKVQFDRYVMIEALKTVCKKFAIYEGNRSAAEHSSQVSRKDFIGFMTTEGVPIKRTMQLWKTLEEEAWRDFDGCVNYMEWVRWAKELIASSDGEADPEGDGFDASTRDLDGAPPCTLLPARASRLHPIPRSLPAMHRPLAPVQPSLRWSSSTTTASTSSTRTT